MDDVCQPCGMCREMPCCPDHCCDWDDCDCGDCEQCGGGGANSMVLTTTDTKSRGALEEPKQECRSFLTTSSFWDSYFKNTVRDNCPRGNEFATDVRMPTILQLVSSLMPTRFASILDVGCGDSSLVHALARDGHANVLGVDFSRAAIQRQMVRAEAPTPSGRTASFAHMDARSLGLRAASIDLAIDKATIDAVVCDPTHGSANAHKLLMNVSRVLRAGGVCLHFSDANQEKRLRLLNKPEYGWKVNSQPTEEGVKDHGHGAHLVTYVYVLRKD